jgi:transcriptional regulator with XRE-family HTH domain
MSPRRRKPRQLKFSERELALRRAGAITLQELADRHQVSVSTVWGALKALGLSGRGCHPRRGSRAKHEAVVQYADQGLSLAQIGQRVGLCRERVRQILARHGVVPSPCRRCGAVLRAAEPVHHYLDGFCVDCFLAQPGGLPGRRLRALRLARDWTQKELATRSGLSAHTICRLESDQFQPNVQTLRKLAEALGTSPAALLGPDAAGPSGERG